MKGLTKALKNSEFDTLLKSVKIPVKSMVWLWLRLKCWLIMVHKLYQFSPYKITRPPKPKVLSGLGNSVFTQPAPSA